MVLLLILFVLLLLVLLLLLFLVQLVDHLPDNVFVVFCVRIVWIDFQRLIVVFERFSPLLYFLVLSILQRTPLHQCIAQVVFRLFPHPLVRASKDLAEGFQGLVVIAFLVGRRAAVEFQSV